jgi:cyclic pyranopterin phosphate synthase
MPFVTEKAGRLHGHKLEYNLADHCNLSCRECSHLSPYIRKHFASIESFERDLSRLAEVYRVHRFRFVGGEPLLNREILRFVRAVRTSGIAAEIEVVTNGLLLERLDAQLLQHLDSVAVSAYPAAGDLGPALRATRELCDRYGVRLQVEHVDRFRRMQAQGPITDESFVKTIFDSCLIAHTWSCQTFYEGFFYLCSRPIYTDSYLQKLGAPPGNFRQVDGIALHEPELGARLRAYLRSTEPLSACQHCLGTVGKYEPHAQLDHMERKQPSMPATASESIDTTRLHRLLRWHRVASAILHRIPSLRVSRLLAMAETAVIGD